MTRALWDIRFIKFIFVGGVSAIVDIGILSLVLHFTDYYQVAILVGFIAGLTVNHFLHSRYTFRLESHSLAQVARFLIVVALNYGVTVLIVFGAHEVFNTSVVIAKIISLPVVAVIGFLLSKYWAFAPHIGE